MGTKDSVMKAFSACRGLKSCNLTLNAANVSSSCLAGNSGKYIFLNAVCQDTAVTLDFGFDNTKFEKSTIALIAVVCDVVSIFAFTIGIAMYADMTTILLLDWDITRRTN